MYAIYEIIMLIALNAAICIILFRLAKGISADPKADRVTAFTMGLGFIAGIVKCAVDDFLCMSFILYAAGAMLCYMAVLLSVPDKVKKKKEEPYE